VDSFPAHKTCEEGVGRLQRILHSLETRVPRIVLQRVEEIFPAVKERIVSELCMCQLEDFVIICQFSWRNKLDILSSSWVFAS
jgi:hypothetical protein